MFHFNYSGFATYEQCGGRMEQRFYEYDECQSSRNLSIHGKSYERDYAIQKENCRL